MMVVMPAFLQLVNLCVIVFALALQGSTGLNLSPSPEPLSVNPPTETAPGPIPDRKSLGSNVPSPALQPNGSDFHPVPALPPLAPPKTEVQVPSISPSTPAVFPPPNTAPPPVNVPEKKPSVAPITPPIKAPVINNPVLPPLMPPPVPSKPEVQAPSTSPRTPAVLPPPSTVPPPTAPPEKAPVNKNPVSVPVAPVSVVTPSKNVPPSSPVINSTTPEVSPSSSHQRHASAPVSSLPKAFAPNPAVVHSVTPSTAPTILPVPVASPSKLPQTSPSTHPVTPGESPSTLTDPEVSPVSSPPPSIKRDGKPIVAPPSEAPKPSVPLVHSPAAAPSVNKPVVSSPTPSTNWKRDRMPVAAPPNEAPKPSLPIDHTPAEAPSAHKPEVSSPTPGINREKGRIPVVAPPSESPKPSLPVGQNPAKAPSAYKPTVSSPSPSINRKRSRTPIVAPPYEAPKPSLPTGRAPAEAPVHKSVRHYKLAPAPSNTSPEPPFDKGYPSPASSPSSSFYKPNHTRTHIPNPSLAPSDSISPSTSKQQGPVIAPGPVQTKRRRHYASPPLYSEGHVSPAPSPSLKDASDYTKIPPNHSPAGSLPSSPKVPPLPAVQVFPPPPPNEDCSSTFCSDPYTNTPPGSPCVCVLPMQVGLRLSVPLYTFFPLVSELAQEIAVGVFMEQSQVRIIGANAANQGPEKTVVLVDLVPMGETFDSTTAFLTSQRFWHKQVVIKSSDFGDYEVLYVRYTGLPPSPPSSDADVINAGPYPGNDNNSRTIKPFGVNVPKRRHKNGLSGGIIAIIALSTFVAVALCSAVAWLLLFKPRDHASHLSSTPRTLLPSIGKRSGTAGSMRDSRHSSESLSFGSSIATYTGSANTFSASDISRATNNFDPSRILGEGGFGLVYRGVLEDGTEVAVKVLKRDDQQGGREFLAEVEMLSRLHHRNLVKLIGICVEERARCLIYELIPNGSLESHLHGIDKEAAPLSWGPRMKIALGAARGLAYLHEDSSPRVIHRDFKSSNILLENDFTPKVSDFGLARSALDGDNKHISTRVMGTFGYVAPEYAMTGHLLVKSDVYSYGVVLLELLTGRRPVDMSQPPGEENLVAWARPLLTSREGLEAMVDQNLGSDIPFDSIAKVAAIASMCVQPEVSHRPFMGEVVQALKLVCNEFDEAKEIGSHSSSPEDLSIDMAAGTSTTSEQLPYTFQRQYSAPTYDSDLEADREASLLKLYSTSAVRMGKEDSESFRRHSSSGPLGTGRSKQFWQRLRSSGGSVSEHGFKLKLWQGSH